MKTTPVEKKFEEEEKKSESLVESEVITESESESEESELLNAGIDVEDINPAYQCFGEEQINQKIK